MCGGPTLTNFKNSNNLTNFAEIQAHLAQQPATCRPASSANNRLIDNWE